MWRQQRPACNKGAVARSNGRRSVMKRFLQLLIWWSKTSRPRARINCDSGTAMTMPCVKASLPRWSVSCWTATASVPQLKPAAKSSTLSRASTTHIGYTHHWVITPRLSSKGGMPPYLQSQTRNCPPKWGNFMNIYTRPAASDAFLVTVSKRPIRGTPFFRIARIS